MTGGQAVFLVTGGQAVFLACVAFWFGFNSGFQFGAKSTYGWLDVIGAFSFFLAVVVPGVVFVTVIVTGVAYIK